MFERFTINPDLLREYLYGFYVRFISKFYEIFMKILKTNGLFATVCSISIQTKLRIDNLCSFDSFMWITNLETELISLQCENWKNKTSKTSKKSKKPEKFQEIERAWKNSKKSKKPEKTPKIVKSWQNLKKFLKLRNFRKKTKSFSLQTLFVQ